MRCLVCSSVGLSLSFSMYSRSCGDLSGSSALALTCRSEVALAKLQIELANALLGLLIGRVEPQLLYVFPKLWRFERIIRLGPDMQIGSSAGEAANRAGECAAWFAHRSG